jgi:hypothetical protein
MGAGAAAIADFFALAGAGAATDFAGVGAAAAVVPAFVAVTGGFPERTWPAAPAACPNEKVMIASIAMVQPSLFLIVPLSRRSAPSFRDADSFRISLGE